MAWSVSVGSTSIPQDEDETKQSVITSGISKTKGHNQGHRKRPLKDVTKDIGDGDELMCGVEKKRRLTAEQVNFLETSFSMDLKLEPERKAHLAKQLGIQPRQVAIWFQNRRARWKNQQIEQDYESLKASYEAVVEEKERLLKEHDLALEANKRLQAEIARLTRSLQSYDRNGMSEPKEEQLSSGKSEVMSTSKSVNDQSETQDSGQSYQTAPEAAIFTSTNPCIDQLSSAGTSGLESVVPTFPPPENNYGGVPILVQQLIAKGYCTEFAYNVFDDCEKHFSGFAWNHL